MKAKCKIVPLSEVLLGDMGRANEPFWVFGRIVPQLRGGVWSYTEEIFPEPYEKTYPADENDWRAYISGEDKAAFLAYMDGKCAGQIVLRRDWNRYAFIEDIAVAASARRQGVGTALMERAKEWAAQGGMQGLALETQDNNLAACRFYAKCGFAVGAVNTMLYRNFERPYCDETAVFWYMRF